MKTPSHAEKELLESTGIYVESIIDNMPVSPSYMQMLKEHVKLVSVCTRVMDMDSQGRPDNAQSEPLLKNYWPNRATLTVKDGLLLRDSRLVIPSAMHNDVLTKIHKGKLNPTLTLTLN